MKSEKQKVNLSLPIPSVAKLDELAKRGHRKRTGEIERLIEEEYRRQTASHPTN